MRYQHPEVLGRIMVDVLRNDFHRPVKDGKCNRENVEDGLIDGIITGHLPPMNEDDVKFICDLIDDILVSGSKPPEAA